MELLYKNKWLAIVTLVLLLANIITLVLLWSGNKKRDFAPPPHGTGPFEFVVNELKLDEKQQQQYKILREEHQQLQKPVTDSLIKARNDYFDLLKNVSVTDSMLLRSSSRTMELQQRMEIINFRHFQKLRAICDPGQQKHFDEILQDILKFFASRRPPFKNGTPPGAEGPPHP